MGNTKSYSLRFHPWIVNMFVILFSVLFIGVFVYGVTTIGNNINTDGNLDVNGTASTTNATTTGYLYVGQDITEPAGWDFTIGDLIVSDDAFFNDQATTSASLWVGSGGTANSLNLAGGDLFVQDDVLFTGGNATFSTGTGTTTAGVFVLGANTGRSTTTFGVGDNNVIGCIELGKNGIYYRVYVNETGSALVVEAGRCKD